MSDGRHHADLSSQRPRSVVSENERGEYVGFDVLASNKSSVEVLHLDRPYRAGIAAGGFSR